MRKLSEAFVLNFVGLILISMKNEVFCFFFFLFFKPSKVSQISEYTLNTFRYFYFHDFPWKCFQNVLYTSLDSLARGH